MYKRQVVKLLGGGYLLYVALKHFIFEGGEEASDGKVQILSLIHI